MSENDKLFELLNKVDSKLDKKLESIDSHLSDIDIKLAVQSEQLGEHMRRTELLEERVAPLEDAFKEFKGFKLWSFIIGGILSSIVGLAYAITGILSHWKK